MTEIRKGMLHTNPDPDPDAATRIAKSGFAPTLDITGTDEDENLVFGWANIAVTKDGTQVSDLQGHTIDIDDLERAAYDFTVKYRKSGGMHKGEGWGDMIESMVYTKDKIEKLGLEEGAVPLGWWVGFEVPPAQFAKVKSGEFKMFSIQGKATLQPLDDEDV